jgi:hypothetical protein
MELQAYVTFATVVTILGIALVFGPKSLNATLVPFTGWAPGLNYIFTLYFAYALVFGRNLPRRTTITFRFAIVAILLIGIFGGYQAVKRGGHADFHNPYLTVNQWQPLWTMVIPAIWILVLLSPRMRAYYNSQNQ